MQPIKYSSIRTITSVEEPSAFEQMKIQSSNDASKFARQFYCSDLNIYESFFIMMLDKGNHTIAWAKIGQGGISSVIVEPRIICKLVLDSLCSSVVLVHNHPSGNISPSQTDKDITDKIKSALTIFDVQLLDHIILTKNNYYSFADNNLI
jgi:DNA repair protein RadC